MPLECMYLTRDKGHLKGMLTSKEQDGASLRPQCQDGQEHQSRDDEGLLQYKA